MTKYRFTGDDRPPPGWKRAAEGMWLLPRLFGSSGEAAVLGPEGDSQMLEPCALTFGPSARLRRLTRHAIHPLLNGVPVKHG